MNRDELLTRADLEKFKLELLDELKKIVNKVSTHPVNKWMKSAEVRKLLGVSPGKLQTMRGSGAIAFTRIGGVIYYDKEEIEKMFERFTVRRK